ncbi:MAG: VacJ family lipoprotein [Magnetococcales bacterium]|nr:VacJ family lipoprotein [Magnetococcales bacterium]NGZ26317.1 VacJ family lipoprotein [Magnetococcales bacterium]
MKKSGKTKLSLFASLLCVGMWLSNAQAATKQEDGGFFPPDMDDRLEVNISDPLEPWNRFWFQVNDTVYEYILRPVARGYAEVVPTGGRVAVADFFHNLLMPVRFTNSLLQGKAEQAVVEVERFGINTVMGGLGFIDVAEIHFQLHRNDEDLGQTLGVYGVGDQVYLVWPILGPSNLRDSVGKIGDSFLSPLTYVPEDDWARVGIEAFSRVNKTSLMMGDYDNMRTSSLDPYVAVRHAYTANRAEKISK